MYVPRNFSNIPKAKAIVRWEESYHRDSQQDKAQTNCGCCSLSNTVHVGSMEEWSSVRPQRCSSTSVQHSYVAVIRIFAWCVTAKAFASPPKGFPTNLSKFCVLWAWPIYSGRAVPICPASSANLCLQYGSLPAVWILQFQSNWCLNTLNENF